MFELSNMPLLFSHIDLSRYLTSVSLSSRYLAVHPIGISVRHPCLNCSRICLLSSHIGMSRYLTSASLWYRYLTVYHIGISVDVWFSDICLVCSHICISRHLISVSHSESYRYLGECLKCPTFVYCSLISVSHGISHRYLYHICTHIGISRYIISVSRLMLIFSNVCLLFPHIGISRYLTSVSPSYRYVTVYHIGSSVNVWIVFIVLSYQSLAVSHIGISIISVSRGISYRYVG